MRIRAHASASLPASWCFKPIPSRAQTAGKLFGRRFHFLRAICTVQTNGNVGMGIPATVQQVCSTLRSNGALWATSALAPSSIGASLGQISANAGACRTIAHVMPWMDVNWILDRGGRISTTSVATTFKFSTRTRPTAQALSAYQSAVSKSIATKAPPDGGKSSFFADCGAITLWAP